jgi:catechol 2,3-dioxygenase-like lactoylglutathione lyase family enzyme
MRLSFAMIYVKDLTRMEAFYGGVLGLRPLAETRTDAWLEFEGGCALHAIPAEIAAEIEISQPPNPREENPVKLIFETPDLAAERTRLIALGVTALDRPWGGCDIVDPEGNVVGLRQTPPISP